MLTILIALKMVLEYREALLASYYEGKALISDEDMQNLITDTADIERFARYDSILDVCNDDVCIKKVIASPVLREMETIFNTTKINREQNKTEKNQLKFALYMGEVKLLESALSCLNINPNKVLSQYSSLVLFELFANKSTEDNTLNFYVRYFYNNELNATLEYSIFMQKISAGAYDSNKFSDFCKSTIGGSSGPFNWLLVGIIAGAIVGAALIISLIMFIKSKCKSSGETKDDDAEEERVISSLKKQLEG